MATKCWHVIRTNQLSNYLVFDYGGPTYFLMQQRHQESTRLAKDQPLQALLEKNCDGSGKVQLEECFPGQYHPRIYRPSFFADSKYRLALESHFEREWASSVQAVRSILSGMVDVFSVIEPEQKNNAAFGHKMRQLLILACTEVESACKAVLKANNYTPTAGHDRWTTKDFVKVAKPLHLHEWEVALRHHRGFPKFKPFETWDPAKPTGSLEWYKAYNDVKHDREANFSQATLKNMITAAGAAFVAVYAQFGQFGIIGPGFNMRETDAFDMTSEPIWSPTEYYLPPGYDGHREWKPRDYVF